MPILILILGALLLIWGVSKYLSSKPENFNNIFSKTLAVVFAGVAFLILIKGNIAEAVVLATGAVLSWQGSLWTYLQSKAEQSTIGPDNEKVRKNKSSHDMSINEALEILELKGNPTPEEIKAAHHKLMMKIHPDQGGSGYFAAKINQAKELLLKNRP